MDHPTSPIFATVAQPNQLWVIRDEKENGITYIKFSCQHLLIARVNNIRTETVNT
ncbi:Uncharacterized protein BM_BM410 [Brugia malayi]|uniref:Bm410 n=1 Tax=Brugia malayi TaxID=6279 RepID=A0A0J9XS48_BRUMA|nr:Uncharacterized protein BM_BM410 [Brugia malayi]CDP94664.1 Bm410 [Brugia malayi]VIO86846.1 Uncharacterized protein BM_BM410 [Brugia malayi]